MIKEIAVGYEGETDVKLGVGWTELHYGKEVKKKKRHMENYLV